MVLVPGLAVAWLLDPGLAAKVAQAPWMAWGNVALLGLLSTALAYVLYFQLLSDIGPLKSMAVTFLIPPFGVFWGVLLLDEPLSWAYLYGGALILLALYLVLKPAVATEHPRAA